MIRFITYFLASLIVFSWSCDNDDDPEPAGFIPGGGISAIYIDEDGIKWFGNSGGLAAFDGETWSELGQGLNGEVLTLQVREGLLIAGGSFYASGTEIMYNAAIWDGEAWRPMGEGEGMRGNVNSLIVHENYLVAGGEFDVAGGVFQQPCGLA